MNPIRTSGRPIIIKQYRRQTRWQYEPSGTLLRSSGRWIFFVRFQATQHPHHYSPDPRNWPGSLFMDIKARHLFPVPATKILPIFVFTLTPLSEQSKEELRVHRRQHQSRYPFMIAIKRQCNNIPDPSMSEESFVAMTSLWLGFQLECDMILIDTHLENGSHVTEIHERAHISRE